MMRYLYPLVRANRAIVSTMVFPHEPLQAIAISEIVSVVGLLLNPFIYKKIYQTIIAVIYAPKYASYIITLNDEDNKIYRQTEMCLLLVFIVTFTITQFAISQYSS